MFTFSLCSCSAVVSWITPAGPTPPGLTATTTPCLCPAVKTEHRSAQAEWTNQTCWTHRYNLQKRYICYNCINVFPSATLKRFVDRNDLLWNDFICIIIIAHLWGNISGRRFTKCVSRMWSLTVLACVSGLWGGAGSAPAGRLELCHACHSGLRHHQGKDGHIQFSSCERALL